MADFDFAAALGEAAGSRAEAAPARAPTADSSGSPTLGQLFKGFVRFYAREFDFRSETISITDGRRGPPSLAMPLHIVVDECGSGASAVAPTIEDPFRPGANLGSCCTYSSVQRLREELERADHICSEGGSLSELLELWAPPVDPSAASTASGTRKPTGSDPHDDAVDMEEED
mmetsp:Transcript_16775/g.48705  ORF Transcript_16775/g.48705 Transcript_16775/m.48705 type:complete len:173 (+) Transcript_16775:203-721(+)